MRKAVSGEKMEKQNSQIKISDKYSLGAKVFERIREDILTQRYQRNDELKEMTIAKELGVSRTPVREALRQLELEGLVNMIPNKGAFVIGITNKDIRDIYEIRSMLEGLCARWAAKNVTDKEIDMLEEINDLSEFHVAKERYEKVLDLDNRFHDMLYQIAGSRMLNHTLSDYHHYLEGVRKVTLSSHERVENTIQEHRAIVAALKSGNAVEAETLANQHIINSIVNIENQHLL